MFYGDSERMQSYKKTRQLLVTLKAGKGGLNRETDQLVSIYDRIVRKGNNDNS